jgi:ABC-type Mn2+/Zn2+ transport system permease subunit
MESVTRWLAEHRIAIWIIIAGAISSANCAILGCFLVLRRMSLLGDAISHAVLPGIVVAFLLAGRSTLAIFAAAIVIGLVTAFCTQTLNSLAKVPEDAAMGIVFTSLFALGVFLLTNFARDVDLDPDCVLYGHIEYLAIDTIEIGGVEVPRAMQTLGLALVATLAFVGLFWKELKIASFDPALASAIGLRAGLVHYLLMAMVALVTVAAFEAVGSVLVIATMIVPAATAQLLTDRLDRMVGWAVVVSVLSAVAGYFADIWFDTGVTGMMAVAAGAQFTLAVLFAPRHGLLAKLLGNFALAVRIVGEDVIGMLYRASEAGSAAAQDATVGLKQCARTVGGGMTAWLAIADQWRRGDLALVGGRRVELTQAGRQRAGSLVRAHRLWEAYLGEHFQLPLDHLHAPAERIEHFIGPHLQDRLAAELHLPATDPHGRNIPEAKAENGKRKAEQGDE